jgi:hypothetical protein
MVGMPTEKMAIPQPQRLPQARKSGHWPGDGWGKRVTVTATPAIPAAVKHRRISVGGFPPIRSTATPKGIRRREPVNAGQAASSPT